MRILGDNFFNRPAPAVARGLIGKVLVRKIGAKVISGVITETEAYEGFRDKASHARRGKTPRNFPMFGPAGRWYVYFVYGNHWMLNIVTGKAGYPAAVLIRGVLGLPMSQILKGSRFFGHRESQNLDGPAKLTKFFKIDKRLNNLPATPKTGLWIENRPIIHNSKFIIRAASRIGVAYAGPYWSRRKWRFCLK